MENVETHFRYAFLRSPLQHRVKLGGVGVHVSVRMQSDEMERRVLFRLRNGFLPNFPLVHGSGFQRAVYQFRTLIENASGTQRVMTDLRVPHIVVTRKPDGLTVRLELRVEFRAEKFVERRSFRDENGVGVILLADADAVHHDEAHGSGTTGERVLFQRKFSHFFLLDLR